MENKNKNIKTDQSEEEDRISNLPDPILVDILSLLETKYAVRTSALSTKWRQLWTFVPNLVFDLRDMYPENASLLRTIFFINKLLVFQDSPPRIQKFSFTCGHVQWRIVADFFHAWMAAILGGSGGVQVLHIDVPVCLNLPPEFFTCETLVDLRLGGDGWYFSRVVLQLPQHVHFPNLKRLYLEVYTPTEDLTTRFFKSCPVLESLTIDALLVIDWYREVTFNIFVETLKELKIVLRAHQSGDSKHTVLVDAPILEEISIEDNLLACYSFRNLSSLIRAYIDVGESFKGALGKDCSGFLFELLKGVSDARYLQLSDHTMRALGSAGNGGLYVFPNLTQAELGVTCSSRLLDLLEKMPQLGSLRLKMKDEGARPNKINKAFGLKIGDHRELPGCLLTHLKLIEVKGFKGREGEQQLVKYFLKNAKVLDEIEIMCEDLASEELRELQFKLKKFSGFRRLVKVSFLDNR
ncbi:hypothetical protein NMG60_11009848 [Bertholletia excelsa]